MLRSLLRRLSYANVVATIALFAALGTGGAYAASKLSKNSVTSATIRDHAIKGKDLTTGAVGSAQIADKSITKSDLAASVRDGLDGTVGPQGPAGANGAAGRDGAGIVTSKAFGYQAINKGKRVTIGTITWTQPAHTLDEVKGWATVPYNGSVCNDGEGPTYLLDLDGKEISYDDNNFTSDGDGVVLQNAPNTVAGAANTVAIGGEAAAEPSDQPREHTLTVTLGNTCMRNLGNAQYGGTVSINDLRLYVVRNSAG